MTEIWKPIPGYEGHYEASSLGRIRSLDRLNARGYRIKGVVFSPGHDGQGYRHVVLTKNGKPKTWKVYQLVCRAFHGMPPGKIGHRRGEWQVNHKDGSRDNDRADNLEWVTKDENLRHGHRTNGRRNTKLRPNDVRAIRRAKDRRSATDLAEEYGVCPGTIYNVWNGATWDHVEEGAAPAC